MLGLKYFEASLGKYIWCDRINKAVGSFDPLISCDSSVVNAILLVDAAKTIPYCTVGFGKMCAGHRLQQ